MRTRIKGREECRKERKEDMKGEERKGKEKRREKGEEVRVKVQKQESRIGAKGVCDHYLIKEKG